MTHPRRIAIGFLHVYRLVFSPLRATPTCRFYPTCSSYSLEAFHKHTFLNALWLTVKRVARCHPWHAGGFDPVP